MRYLAIVICALIIPNTSFSMHTGGAQQKTPDFSPTRLIVKLKPEVDEQATVTEVQGRVTTGLAQLDYLNLKFKVKKQEKLFKEFKKTALMLDNFSSVYVLEVPEGTDLQKMKREYEIRPEVEYAELDYRAELFEEPDDPLFPHQWYLNNVGQGYLGINRVPGDSNDTQIIKYGTVDADIDALEAFESYAETTTPLIGIIDTGVDLDHVDLADNIWINPGEDLNADGTVDESDSNGVDDDHNGFVDDFYGWDFSGHLEGNDIIEDNDPTDYYGHGSHCAGIAAAVRDNAVGVSGISTPCEVMAVKFFPYAFFSLGAKSIIYAADMGCDVINISWGSGFPSKLIEEALDYAIERGVLPIAASGNSGGEDYFYPASLPQVFTVGASNSDDEVTEFSTYGEHVEVVAPGEDILSLRADDTDMYAEGGASGIEPEVHIVDDIYYLADGTSMSSPCVVGVAAHLLAASPGMSKQRVAEIIQESADDILYPFGGDTLYSPGRDIYSGFGRVNLNSALQLLSGRLAKIDCPYENAIVSGDIAILGTASGDSFTTYVLEYGEGLSPTEWTEIAGSDVPVTQDTLGVWSTSGLTGLYTLRLAVGDQNQAVVHVRADNGVDVKITSPSDGDTVTTHVQVWGSTVTPDFSHYVLEYGFGESPLSWIPIDTSTKMVADGILGEWMVSFLESVPYSLRLTAKTSAGETYADTVVVWVEGIASVGWFVDLTNGGSLSPAVGDIDGDGYNEIVVGVGGPEGWGRTGGIEVFTHEGQREAGWPKDTTRNMMSSPALGDLDKDGIDDIVICSEDGIHAYLSGSADWSRSAFTSGNEFWSLATPVLADLENDGYLEVLTATNSRVVYAWRNDGQPVIPGSNGRFSQIAKSSCEGFPCLAVADLDGDGENEVIAGAARGGCSPCWGEGGIYIWDIEGHPLLGPGDYPGQFASVHGIALTNIDENEDMEIIVFGADTNYITLSAFKKDGTQPANYPLVLEDLLLGRWYGNHPAIGDLEGDGILEIVVSVWAPGEARIYAWHQDGTPLGSMGSSGLVVSMKWPDYKGSREILNGYGNDVGEVTARMTSMSRQTLTSPISGPDDPVFVSVAETFGSPILADVDGDGNVDIVARAGYDAGGGYERVYAWDYEGNLLPGWPLYASAQAIQFSNHPYVPVIGDLDEDGSLDMILATDWPDYQLIYWEFDTYHDSTNMHWPKYMHDKRNSGIFRIAEYGYGLSDVIYLLNYLYRGGPVPQPIERADVNCDGVLNIADVVYLVNYLFRGGPAPDF